MADITWTDVTDYASELSTVAVSRQTMILDHVNAAVDPSMFGGETSPTTKLVRVLLAAHFATVSTLASAGDPGPVSSESLGPQSRSYVTLVDPSNYVSSRYGEQYLSIVRNSIARAPLVL